MLKTIWSILQKIRAPYLVLFFWLYISFTVAPWKNRQVINNDIIVYYEYLPAIFIFKDPAFKFNFKPKHNFHGTIWLEGDAAGNRYPKTTMGLAFFYTPFFLVGHAAAILLDYTADGYSLPYRFCLSLCGIFYAFLGLLILEKILRRLYTPWVTAMVIITVGFATNLYFYTSYEGPLPHAQNFFLISLFLWLWLRWYEKTTYLNSILIGLTAGLIFLVRPVNVLVMLIPLLYGVNSLAAAWDKVKFLASRYLQIIVAAFFAFLALVPQFLFWKLNTGNWLVWSYGNETFYFINNHVIEGLISYRSGWLVYTPVMFFALGGLFFLHKYAKEWTLPVIAFTCINIFVVFSWWCWWYGGFSIRALVDSYGVLCIPLGAFYTVTLNSKFIRYLIYPLLSFFIYLNIFQTWQFVHLYVHYSHTTRASYWCAFMKKHPPQHYWDLLVSPDHDAASAGKDEPKGVDLFP